MAKFAGIKTELIKRAEAKNGWQGQEELRSLLHQARHVDALRVSKRSSSGPEILF